MHDSGAPRAPITACVVVVPAHDEVDSLPGALAAIEIASDRFHGEVTVVVVADDCTDGTSAVVPDHVTTRVINARNVGRARRAGFAGHATGEHIWFATTDADSCVPPDWLTGQVRLADAGADAVIGIVTPDTWTGWATGTAERFTAQYIASDGHPHVHGANLGVRSSIYRDIGGFAPLDLHEDVDLVRRISGRGARVARSAATPVRTSTRRIGRTPGGFAAHLVGLTDAPDHDEPVAG